MEDILKKEEGKTLEFKENASLLTGIVKTVVAFTNTAGGTIVVGIEDKTKKIVGITDPLEDEERIVTTISETVTPFIMPNIDIQSYRGKTLILIHVAYAPGPHYLKRGADRLAYVRFGSTNRVADEDTLENLKLLGKNRAFDELPCPQAPKNQINWNVVNDVFKEVSKSITPKKAHNIGILSPQNPAYASNGGMLMFGKNRSQFFPDALIRCVRFAGLIREHSIDHIDIDTYLPYAIDEVMHFIKKNTYVRSHIEHIKRIDTPQYPPLAVREAVINAIVHTDYAIRGSSIIVAIFDDRIEITNPGAVPYGLTLEDAIAGSTRTRNKVITKTFHLLKIIEQWGSGLQKIISAFAQSGLKRPKFEELGSQFRVTLYCTAKEKIILEGWRKLFMDELNRRGELQTTDAVAIWKITAKAARSRLKILIDEGLIVRVGTARNDPHSKYVSSKMF